MTPKNHTPARAAARVAALTALLTASLALAALPAQAAQVGTGGGGCNNYGVVLQAGVSNEYHCTSLVQYCDQGSGAGAGAGAGGPGENEAGAEASAGTNCWQASGGSQGSSEPQAYCLVEVSKWCRA